MGSVEDVGTVVIHSNDPVNPELTVDLLGHGLVPHLTLTPDVFDFGELDVPCFDEVDVTLENTGTKQLTITSFDFTSSSVDLKLDALTEIPQPSVLNPGESLSMTIDYLPEVEDAGATGTLTVESNDPAGDRVATISAAATYADTDVDIFLNPEIPSVDVLLLIDNSCSMEGDNTNDINIGLPALVTELGNVSNWQMIEVTHRNGCSNVPILDASVLDASQQLVANAFSTPGNFSEWLLETASLALSQSTLGGCNSGFLRPGALLHIIVASDEEEQSGVNFNTWVSNFQSYVPRADMVAVSAVVDTTFSCGDGTGPGGYLEAANATGGQVLNICTPYWGAQLTNIADSVANAPPVYLLPVLAIGDSLVVTLDGLVTLDFSYNPVVGALTVTDPAYIKDVSTVTVEYALASTCVP